jgi:TPR repeat protein
LLATCLITAVASAASAASPSSSSSSSSADHPLPSAELQQALTAQAARAQAGSKDLSAFIADLRRIAPHGDPVAQFMLATLIATDHKDEALALLRQSAAAGCTGSMGALGTLLATDEDAAARDWIQRAALKGDTGAQIMLSAGYRNGIFGMQKNMIEAFAWATVAQNNAPTFSMRQAAANAVGTLLTGTDPQMLDGATSRIEVLMKQVSRQEFHLCGFSLP